MKFRLYITALIPVLLPVILASITSTATSHTQGEPERVLVPIGGDTAQVYSDLPAVIVARSRQEVAKILVLPFTQASNPESVTEDERVDILEIAETHRFEIERACQEVAQPGIICEVLLAPIVVRSDAENPLALEYFTSDLNAIYILDGDQVIAKQVIAGTPIEIALAEAYQNGVIIAGSGAGASLLSQTMIAGYKPNFEADHGMTFGAVDLQSGLAFGVRNAILEPNFMQYGHMGRLLNAITLPDAPHIGIGLDAGTGFHLSNGERVENVFGLHSVVILDAETYHTADTIEYHLPHNTLSLRNVLVHMLSPGNGIFDIATRQHLLDAPAASIERSFKSLALPLGAGPLILSGDLAQSLKSTPILTRFVNLSGGERANILVIAAGYPSLDTAQQALEAYQASLRIPSHTLIIPENPSEPPAIPQDLTGIILISANQSLIRPESLQPVKQAWLSGTPLLTDGAATAVIGAYYSTKPMLMENDGSIAPGLGLLNITIEASTMAQNHWGSLFSLAYNHSNLLTLGLSRDTALEITTGGALAMGDNVVFVLDLRNATLDLGTNQRFVIANGLLDAFAPGDLVHPETADMSVAPLHAATPDLTTPTPTPTFTSTPLPTNTPMPTPLPTETPGPPSTRTPRPTITQPIVPPPADPGEANMMILFAILSVMVVLFGIWINRRRFN